MPAGTGWGQPGQELATCSHSEMPVRPLHRAPSPALPAWAPALWLGTLAGWAMPGGSVPAWWRRQDFLGTLCVPSGVRVYSRGNSREGKARASLERQGTVWGGRWVGPELPQRLPRLSWDLGWERPALPAAGWAPGVRGMHSHTPMMWDVWPLDRERFCGLNHHPVAPGNLAHLSKDLKAS